MDTSVPSVGDLISCTDGDVGLVLEVTDDDDDFSIRAMWLGDGATYTDPWGSEDFMEGRGIFSVLSRAQDESR